MLIRNLIYHVAALPTNDLWLKNVQQLAARHHIFNGHRVIAVADGPELEPWETVARVVQSLVPCRILRVRNDRNLREVASFRQLLDEVARPAVNQVTFYAHTKGNSTVDDPQGALYWRNAMYYELLDKYERCIELLSKYPAVGTTKIVWAGTGKRCPYPSMLTHGMGWMFAGTFFWFRNDRVFNTNRWTSIPQDRYGAEAWLSGMFRHDEVKSVFQPWPENKYPAPSPYNPEIYARCGRAFEDIELTSPSYVI